MAKEKLMRALMISSLAKSNKPKLLDQVRITLRTNHYSPKTEESYVSWIKQFIIFNNKTHPEKLGIEEMLSIHG